MTKQRIAELEAEMAKSDFWKDKKKAQEIVKEYQELKEQINTPDKYSKGNAIISILSGAGGDDAEDWARILFEMYQKFCQKKEWEISILHEHRNDFGGLKNITFEVSARGGSASGGKGKGVYGQLKGENGVHRLVRISPFSPKKLRHTSFAMVEILPDFGKNVEREVELKPDDLKIDFFRSSGPGGQHVNKRETAVRITHLPSGISASCQNERSQERNREKAMKIIYSKLYQQKIRQLVEEKEEIKSENLPASGGKSMAEWGRQIRSYVLHPYKMVKDHRTKVETSDVDSVLEGDLDIFIRN